MLAGWPVQPASAQLSISERQEPELPSPQELLKESAKRPEAFRILKKGGVSGTEENVATYYWPVGHEIKVGFLSGDHASRELVKSAAAEWFAYANLKATYVENADQAE